MLSNYFLTKSAGLSIQHVQIPFRPQTLIAWQLKDGLTSVSRDFVDQSHDGNMLSSGVLSNEIEQRLVHLGRPQLLFSENVRMTQIVLQEYIDQA
ncbi:hypothetical protein ABZR78_31260 [Pseudomonas aeruginosa]